MMPNKAFSLVELSIVILVIGILVSAITKGSAIYRDIKLEAARSVTQSSRVNSIDGLVLWLETSNMDSIQTFQNDKDPQFGDNVKSWRDNRIVPDSQKFYFTQNDATKQPVLLRDGIGGLPAIEFDGDSLKSYITPLKAGDKTYSMIAVWQSNYKSSAARMMMIVAQDGGSYYDMAGLFIRNNSTLSFAGNTCDIDIAGDILQENIFMAVINNNLDQNAKLYLNSNTPKIGKTTVGSCSGGGQLNLSNSHIFIGTRSGDSQLFIGKISEIIIFDRDLKQNEIEQINSYLSQKYGIKIK